MKKIMCVFGTRPEALKLVPVIRELENYRSSIQTIICSTGQHDAMLNQVLSLFSITPHYNLKVMKQKQSLTQLSADLLTSLEVVFQKEQPDMVVVQGDTATACLASMCAYYHQIPVAHIEAGLRSGDKYQPFPEEINRKIMSTIADLHFTPTRQSKKNLLRENIKASTIHHTGNTIIDALAMLENTLPPTSPISQEKNILLTAHRRENLGKPLTDICKAIVELVKRNPGIRVIYPVHLNPLISSTVHRFIENNSRIVLLPPQSYIEFIQLMRDSYLIITDSGGIQEEAAYLHKPVLILRNTTERPEGIAAGLAKLIGTKKGSIIAEVEQLITNKEIYYRMTHTDNPYGNGNARKKIVKVIKNFLY